MENVAFVAWPNRGDTFLMDNVVNLADYRKRRDEEEIAYLHRLLDEIMASLPEIEEHPMMARSEQVDTWIDLFPQTNLTGYETPPEE
jgi:predicted RNA-binding protein Jag